MAKFLVKFQCLSRGDLVAASLITTSGAAPKAAKMQELFSGGGSSSDKKGGKKGGKKQQDDDDEGGGGGDEGLAAGFDGDFGTGLAAYEAAYGEGSAAGGSRVQRLPKTSHIQEAMRIAVAEFFTRMPAGKCHNCGCSNPSIRKQGSSRLFKQYTKKALTQNQMRGIDVASLVGAGSRAAAQSVGEMMAQQQQVAAAAAAARDAAAGKKRKRGAAAAAEAEQAAAEEDEQVCTLGVFVCGFKGFIRV